jgi:outer membrane receptor protein involved in Fe transport
VRAKGGELGVRAAPFKGFQTSLALWRLDIASELLFAGDAGTTEPSRPSTRHGIEWASYYKPHPLVTADFDLTLSKARFKDDDPAVGNHIPGATNRTASGGITLGGERGWTGGLRLRYFGPRALIEDNSQRSQSSTLVNAKLSYAFSKEVRLNAEVLNLTNNKVNDIEYFYTSRLQGEPVDGVADRHVHPAEPRALRVSLTLRF